MLGHGRKMPCTVRDASLVTVRKRNKALNSYYSAWKNATVLSGNPSSAVTPPAKTSAEVIKEVQLGCTACYIYENELLKDAGLPYDTNVSLYPFNPSRGGASGLTGTS